MAERNVVSEPIYLEPFVNEHGRVLLRDSASKREIALLGPVEVRNGSDGQVAVMTVIIDPDFMPSLEG